MQARRHANDQRWTWKDRDIHRAGFLSNIELVVDVVCTIEHHRIRTVSIHVYVNVSVTLYMCLNMRLCMCVFM